MKNTSANTRRNRKQIGSQNPTRSMRYATKCMTQSAFQKKILNLVQRAGDKVAEAMNLVDEAGAIAGINVHFERCVERDEHSKRTDVHDKSYEADESDEADDIDEFDEASDEIKEVTLPELADMVSERTCFKPECTLCVLNTAFDIMDEQKLMLDLGTISADTSEEDTEEDADDSEYDEEGADTEDEATYSECGCHDCDNCRHYDDCYGKSDSGYDESSNDDVDDEYNCEDNDGYDDNEDFNDGYDYDDCGDDDYDDDEITSQPTRNTRNSRNASRREW